MIHDLVYESNVIDTIALQYPLMHINKRNNIYCFGGNKVNLKLTNIFK